MAKQCTGATCSSCENWDKKYTAPNPDFHFCVKLNMFTRKAFYCSNHESTDELEERLDDNYFDEEYS